MALLRLHRGSPERESSAKPSAHSETSLLWDTLNFSASCNCSSTLPPLAAAISQFAGPLAGARLGLSSRGWCNLTPTNLGGDDRRQWACEHWPRDAASRLLSSEAWPHKANAQVMAACLDEAWALVSQAPAVLAQPDTKGLYPLHVAARQGCLPLCLVLLEARADVNVIACGFAKWTPLHCAAAAGDAACTRALLAARADPDRQDEMMRVPFEIAVRQRSEIVQEVLLARMEPPSIGCAGDRWCTMT